MGPCYVPSHIIHIYGHVYHQRYSDDIQAIGSIGSIRLLEGFFGVRTNDSNVYRVRTVINICTMGCLASERASEGLKSPERRRRSTSKANRHVDFAKPEEDDGPLLSPQKMEGRPPSISSQWIQDRYIQYLLSPPNGHRYMTYEPPTYRKHIPLTILFIHPTTLANVQGGDPNLPSRHATRGGDPGPAGADEELEPSQQGEVTVCSEANTMGQVRPRPNTHVKPLTNS
eukprot:350853-Prorocentrum_minimum.AAC.2